MPKVKISEECIGCRACETFKATDDTNLFEVKDDGFSHFTGKYCDEVKDSVQDAIDGCPVSAISVDEA